MSTTRVHHKPASVNPLASHAYQEIEDNEDELDTEEDNEESDDGVEWSDEEDGDDFEDDFEDYDNDDDYDSDTEEDDHDDDDEYLDEEESRYGTRRNNDYTSAGPGYFYPEQPYIGPPIVPKPSPEASSSKLRYYILSPICDIATIYVKFAILAILVYACALWYTVYFGDLSSITTPDDMDDNDADTCPA